MDYDVSVYFCDSYAWNCFFVYLQNREQNRQNKPKRKTDGWMASEHMNNFQTNREFSTIK